MKKIIFSLVVLSLLWSCNDTKKSNTEYHAGIKFEKYVSWDSLLIVAKEANKPVFIDCYAAWCGPCMAMATDVFPDTTVGDYMNAHYVSYKIDMEKKGVDLAKKFEIKGYPTYVFLNTKGEEIHRSGNWMRKEDFLQLVMNAKDYDKNLNGFKTKFAEGNREKQFLIKYTDALQTAGLDFSEPANAYLELLSEEDYFTQDTYEFFLSYLTDINAKETKTLLANKEKLISVFSEDEYHMLMQQIAVANSRRLGRKMNSLKLEELQAFLKDNKIAEADRYAFDIELNYYKQTKSWSKYEKYAIANLEKFYADDAHAINSVAWKFYQHVENKSSLLKAANWLKAALQGEEDYYIMDTWACLLYKAEVYDQAKYAAMKAIEVAKKKGKDFSETQKILDKINEQLKPA